MSLIRAYTESLQTLELSPNQIVRDQTLDGLIQGKDLEGMRFINVKFKKVQFKNCKLTGCKLINTQGSIELHNTVMNESVFNDCQLSISGKYANLSDSRIESCARGMGIHLSLEESDVSGITVKNSLVSPSLDTCKGFRMVWQGSIIDDGLINDSDLSDLEIDDTEVKDIGFERTDLSGLDVEKTKLSDCYFTDVKVDTEELMKAERFRVQMIGKDGKKISL